MKLNLILILLLSMLVINCCTTSPKVEEKPTSKINEPSRTSTGINWNHWTERNILGCYDLTNELIAKTIVSKCTTEESCKKTQEFFVASCIYSNKDLLVGKSDQKIYNCSLQCTETVYRKLDKLVNENQ